MKTYLISDGTYVKIGKSDNIQQRFGSIQTHHPLPLMVVLIVDRDVERELHQRFSKYKKRGEWYLLSQEIYNFIRGSNWKPRESMGYEETQLINDFVEREHIRLMNLYHNCIDEIEYKRLQQEILWNDNRRVPESDDSVRERALVNK